MLIQYRPLGRNASEISRDVETAVREGRAQPGALLPPVRTLAAALGLSPVTVASAYRELREKGIARGNGRAGTKITGAPPIGPRPALAVPPGARNLMVGSPDPSLLPELPSLRPQHRLYGDPPVSPRFGRLAAERFAADGIAADHLAVVGGALDGVERVFGAWLRPGDRVAVEDPGYPPVLDLLSALDLSAVPMALDEDGVTPAALQGALARGSTAVLFTPRAQAPTGAAWDEQRAAALAEVLAAAPGVLVIEDDHAGPVSGAAAHSVAGVARRWATIRSVSKSIGPDLRLAVMAGDAVTVSRVEGRQALGTGWVSYQLQEMVAELWSDASVGRTLAVAAQVYADRGAALRSALAAHGITATGRSGFTCWVPVTDEDGVASSLAAAGWAVAPGQRFRIASPSGVRISFARLDEADAASFAAEFARALRHRASRLD